MKLRLWQVDAFTNRRLTGNPAAVVPLERWLPDDVMLAIAAENNLSETAFFVREPAGWHIRWFTPTMEVELCGHATLASAHVLLHHLEPGREGVTFASRSGPLAVTRAGTRLALDLPAYPSRRVDTPLLLVEALGATPVETWLGVKMMALFEREEQVVALAPDFGKVARIEAFGVIATAPGARSDIASRYFVPQAGVDEDPVTGAAHCQLTPYWARRLGKARLHARQVSKRGGELWCEDRGARVTLEGEAVDYLVGTIEV
jgi:predicted PhzF superfamily epimerase YddE/YHI9